MKKLLILLLAMCMALPSYTQAPTRGNYTELVAIGNRALTWWVNANGDATFTSISGITTVDISDDTNLAVTLPLVLTDDTLSLDLTLVDGITVGDGAASTSLTLDGLTATKRSVFFETATSKRWEILTNDDAESTGEAGANFVIASYLDAGTLKENVLTIERSSGDATLLGALNLVISSTVTPSFTAHGNADNFIIDSSGAHNGLTIVMGATQTGNIYFADAGVDNDKFKLSVDNNTNEMIFTVDTFDHIVLGTNFTTINDGAEAQVLKIFPDGTIVIGTTGDVVDRLWVDGDATIDGDLTVTGSLSGSVDGGNPIRVTDLVGTNRDLKWQTGTSDRFIMRVNSDLEDGSPLNDGSVFEFFMLADNGTTIIGGLPIIRIDRDGPAIEFFKESIKLSTVGMASVLDPVIEINAASGRNASLKFSELGVDKFSWESDGSNFNLINHTLSATTITTTTGSGKFTHIIPSGGVANHLILDGTNFNGDAIFVINSDSGDDARINFEEEGFGPSWTIGNDGITSDFYIRDLSTSTDRIRISNTEVDILHNLRVSSTDIFMDTGGGGDVFFSYNDGGEDRRFFGVDVGDHTTEIANSGANGWVEIYGNISAAGVANSRLVASFFDDGISIGRSSQGGVGFRFDSMNVATRDGLPATLGTVVFNSDTSKLQIISSVFPTVWTNLH